MADIQYKVGRTMVQMPFDPECGRPEFKRVFHVLAYVEGIEYDPYVHQHRFDYEPDAEELLAKVQDSAPDEAHLEASEHWEQEGNPAPEDRMTLEEKWLLETFRERQMLR